MSKHAALRAQQRGVTPELIETILENEDAERWAGDNTRELGVSRRTARAIGGPDKLCRIRVLLSDNTNQIRTVLPRTRRRYRAKPRHRVRTHGRGA
jgi:hypothetical protein